MNTLIVYGVCALILLIAALRGRHVGFLRSAFSLATVVISIVLVNTFSPMVDSAIRATPIPGMIYRTVYQNLEKEIMGVVGDVLPGNDSHGQDVSGDTSKDSADGDAADPGAAQLSEEQQQQWMQSAGIPRWIRDQVCEGTEQAAATLAENAARAFSDFLVGVLSFVLSLILMWVTLQVISMFLGIVDHIPILNGVNRTLGTVLGLAEGLILIWFLSLLVTVFAPSPLGGSILAILEGSPVLSALYRFLVTLGRA